MRLDKGTREFMILELDKIETTLDEFTITLVRCEQTKDISDILYQLTNGMNTLVYIKGLLELYIDEIPIQDHL